MIRVFFFYLLPIILPSLMYFCWIRFINKGGETGSDKATLVREGPWFRLIFAGIALMIVGLVITAFTGGMEPDGKYQAPYAKDGKIVPGRMIPRGQ